MATRTSRQLVLCKNKDAEDGESQQAIDYHSGGFKSFFSFVSVLIISRLHSHNFDVDVLAGGAQVVLQLEAVPPSVFGLNAGDDEVGEVAGRLHVEAIAALQGHPTTGPRDARLGGAVEGARHRDDFALLDAHLCREGLDDRGRLVFG